MKLVVDNDNSTTINDEGFTSTVLGIGAYAPDKKIESVIVFCDGYYSI